MTALSTPHSVRETRRHDEESKVSAIVGPIEAEQLAERKRVQTYFNTVKPPSPKQELPRPLSPFDPRRIAAERLDAQRQEEARRAAAELDATIVTMANGETLLPFVANRPDPTSYEAFVAGSGAFKWREIVEEVATKHQLRVVDLCSARRGRELVWARHEAMWRLRNETNMSLPAIGRKLGGRDHTTVLHGIQKHEARIASGEAA